MVLKPIEGPIEAFFFAQIILLVEWKDYKLRSHYDDAIKHTLVVTSL